MELRELDGMFGTWRFPNNEKKIQGFLKYEDNTLSITTSDSLTENYIGVGNHAIIDGFLEDGNQITLYGCMQLNSAIAFPGFLRLAISPTYVLVGKRYKNENLKVKQISATFDGLSRWIGEGVYSVTKNWDGNKKEIVMHYFMPIFYKVKCGSKEIDISCEAETHTDIFSSYSLDPKMRVTISYDEKVEWTEAYSDLYDYAEFLTLCMGSKCIPKHIKVKDVEDTDITIFENTEQEKTKLKKSFLVDYIDIADNYEEILNNWYMKQEEISPVINFFVDAHSYERIDNSIPRFLKMVQALESFSRKLRKGTLVSPEEHQNRIENIISQIVSEEDKKWLKDKLSDPIINEPSLQQRITSLFYEIPYEDLNIKKKELESLSNKIVNTRNYYTRFDESLKTGILDSRELVYASTFMKYVLRMLLGIELGLNMDKMVSRISADSEFGTAVNELDLINNDKEE